MKTSLGQQNMIAFSPFAHPSHTNRRRRMHSSYSFGRYYKRRRRKYYHSANNNSDNLAKNSSTSSLSSSSPSASSSSLLHSSPTSSTSSSLMLDTSSLTSSLTNSSLSNSETRSSSNFTSPSSSSLSSYNSFSHTSLSSSSSPNEPHSRNRRSVSVARYVETMVVADQEMVAHHGKEVEHYLLTLMSIVHSIYKHSSIGNSIAIIVTKIVVIESVEAGPQITDNAARTLERFCRWQARQNEHEDSSPNHHDTAVLVTRHDICRAQNKCDTLGLAELGTMCDAHLSCSISEDNGLSAAFTISHELGHVFNLPHDDGQKCKQFANDVSYSSNLVDISPQRYYVMASTLGDNAHPWSWSQCSARLLTGFLDSGYGECLLDKPTDEQMQYYDKAFKGQQPGELFDVDKQCELVFGVGSYGCHHNYSRPACKRLWCTDPDDPDGCMTQHMPWADGSKCDDNKWCLQGECVKQKPVPPVDGKWSKWYGYGQCSRTCGGGIKKAVRECNSPAPRNGGKYCIGRRVKYRSCNTQECTYLNVTFRDQQCSAFDGQHFNINGLPPDVRWKPYYTGIRIKDQCKLYCQVVGGTAYYILKDKVEDGTKCSLDTSDICVNGQCRRASCDNRLGSTAKRDRCGVCGGDNSSCRTISGTFGVEENTVNLGYNHVVHIPKGATNIDIHQHGYNGSQEDHNYLALAILESSDRKFILNGHWTVSQSSKEISVKGSILTYSGSNQVVERITSTEIIQEDLEVLVLSAGKLYPPDIRYFYTISDAGVQKKFYWSNMGPWTECSHICQGERERRIVCLQEDNEQIVSDQRCEEKWPGKALPEVLRETCNRECTVGWEILERSECSVRCGEGITIRRIKCVKRSPNDVAYLEDGHCLKVAPKPEEKAACLGPCLATHWQYTEWSACGKSCGLGYQHREAMCVDTNNEGVPEIECDPDTKVTVQSCNEEPCPRWIQEEWTGCSVTCGNGVRHRQVWCKQGERTISDSHCPELEKPKDKKNCSLDPCPTWFSGHWGACSVTCGVGHTTRTIMCGGSTGILLKDGECNAAIRPMSEKKCIVAHCPTTVAVSTVSVTTPASLQTQWRTGSWTACSASCGYGHRERYVSCRESDGSDASDHACAHTERPPATERCIVRSCFVWRIGEWGPCSESCGKGVATRYVACATLDDLEGVKADPTECNISIKPDVQRPCNMGNCIVPVSDALVIATNRADVTARWRTGPWGGCSSTCEGGWQQRRVVCQDENNISDKCDASARPPEKQSCNSGPCPFWNNGEWGECSRSCSGGVQERYVVCQLPSGQPLPDISCDILRRPSSSQRCAMIACSQPSAAYWHTYPWSQCSVTCGKGERERQVLCTRDGEAVDDEECIGLKPKTVRRCKAGRCPRWITSEWGECSVSCGKGVRQRTVDCGERRGEFVDTELCANLSRPASRKGCFLKDCGQFYWEAQPWQKCSKMCGTGVKIRKVLCIDSKTHQPSQERMCKEKTRPKKRRRCADEPCPYTWSPGAWAECSRTCGEGQQTRTLTCQTVTPENWLVPGDPALCQHLKRPSTNRTCNLGHCRALYHWRTGPWASCSQACGSGTSRRRVHCVDVTGVRRPNQDCRSSYKPSTSKKCYLRSCYAQSCQELREKSSVQRDGDYMLLVKGKLIKIYCFRMRKSEPVEYLSIVAGERENFSEIYGKRLENKTTCPYHGRRKKNCDCLKVDYKRAGITHWSKVRLNITSLQVIVDDFRFASTPHGSKQIPYGTAGDCYSLDNCPQGRFKIDLRGTAFTIARSTIWHEYGHRTSSHITFSQDNNIIEGTCGGHCGRCQPHLEMGLLLDTLP